jgi:DNA-binding transcriptional regulator YiaG
MTSQPLRKIGKRKKIRKASVIAAFDATPPKSPSRNRAVSAAYHTEAVRQLRRIRGVLQLSGPELGSVFGVTRQAIDQWCDNGIPPEQLASIDRVSETVDELSKRFKPLRLPAIVRAPMPILDNRSILRTLKDDGPSAIFEFFRRWSSYVPDVEPIRRGDG